MDKKFSDSDFLDVWHFRNSSNSNLSLRILRLPSCPEGLPKILRGQIPPCSVGKKVFFRSNFHGLSFVLCIKRAYMNIAKSENLVGCVVIEGSRSRAWPNGVKCDTKLSRTLNFTATLLWSFRFLSKRWISASRMSRNFSY